MDYIWAVLALAVMFAVQLLHVFSLPANWIALAMPLVWKMTHPDGALTWAFFFGLVGLAALGEGLEFASQYFGAKRYGATGRGNLGGIIGAIAGAILGAPFLLGLGALIGALAGSFIGCYLFEVTAGRASAEARSAAWGAFFGKSLGLIGKAACGATICIMSATRIWP